MDPVTEVRILTGEQGNATQLSRFERSPDKRKDVSSILTVATRNPAGESQELAGLRAVRRMGT